MLHRHLVPRSLSIDFFAHKPSLSGCMLNSTHIGDPFASPLASHKGINPADILKNSNNGTMNNNNFGGSMNHSYGLGNASIADDELEQLLDDGNSYSNFPSGFNGNNISDQNSFFNNNIAVSHQQSLPAQYSHTPNDAPIQSPFARGSFNSS